MNKAAGTPGNSHQACDLEALRNEFPTLQKWIYLDIARKAPMPRCVEAATRAFFQDIYDEAGHRAFSLDAVDETRAELAGVLGVTERTLAFVKNTSEGLNLAVQSLALHAGDNVVTGEFEHEAQMFALRVLAERCGIEIRVAKAIDGRIPPSSLIALMDENTRLCAVSHVAFSNGFRIDLSAIASECRPRNILLMTDMIQSVGLLDVKLPDLGADIVVAGCHKSLLALNGTAFLYCREEIIDRLRPSFAAKNSVVSDRLGTDRLIFRPDARRFEYGNPNFLGIAALSASLRLIKSIGLPQIEQRVRELSTTLIEKASGAGVEIRTPIEWRERAGIVSFKLPGDPEETVRRLAAKRIVANIKDGHVRASMHAFNSQADIDAFLDVLTSA